MTQTEQRFVNAKKLFAIINDGREGSEKGDAFLHSFKYNDVTSEEFAFCIKRSQMDTFMHMITRPVTDQSLQVLFNVRGIPRKELEYCSREWIQLTVSLCVHTDRAIICTKTKSTHPHIDMSPIGSYTLPQGHVRGDQLVKDQYTIKDLDVTLRNAAIREFTEEVKDDSIYFYERLWHVMCTTHGGDVYTTYINYPGSLSRHLNVIYDVHATKDNELEHFLIHPEYFQSGEPNKHDVVIANFKTLSEAQSIAHIDPYLKYTLSVAKWAPDFVNKSYLKRMDFNCSVMAKKDQDTV